MKQRAIRTFLYDTLAILSVVLGVFGSFGAFDSGSIGFIRMIFQVAFFAFFAFQCHKMAELPQKRRGRTHIRRPHRDTRPTHVMPAA